ncbi:hypothetical protein BGX24_008181 [Mortierella sp. AD032]|nr:hypothetical protein BGX24_008181 [Mortierella sp. AD032]
MSGPIQNGRYKIWRSRERRQLILAADGPGSMAALGHPSDYKDFHYAETGIWIVSTVATPSNTVNHASADAVSATVQHEGNKEYLAVNNTTEVSRHSSICIKSDDRQVWTLSPASTTGGEGGRKNEFHIRYPALVDDQGFGGGKLLTTLALRDHVKESGTLDVMDREGTTVRVKAFFPAWRPKQPESEEGRDE